MKRIVSACLEQTCKFENAEDYKTYIASLDAKDLKYSIVSVEDIPEGVLAKMKLQYLKYDTGEYI